VQGEVSLQPGDWVRHLAKNQSYKLVAIERLWEVDQALIWAPGQDTLSRVPLADLVPANRHPEAFTPAQIAFRSLAARLSDALIQENLLAPLSADLLPLPHQLRALQRALGGQRLRYLLADEVGLGKTIEAGLILRELKLRGRVKRTLVVAPKGIAPQWVAEMRTRFSERFHLLLPGEFQGLFAEEEAFNLFRLHDQVVVSMDSVKPLEKRRGWNPAQVRQYNRQRFDDLINAGWDLVIVDEAHRLGGSTEQIARYRLGQGLAGAAPYLLLLSATPHQGKRDAFQRLVALLDEDAFPDLSSVSRERVQPYVIRTEKRQAIDAQGQPLFKPRSTRRISVDWQPNHQQQRVLYSAVSEYVRQGYNQARQEKRNYIGFLMTLVQRLVTSSTRAIRATLERRLEALRQPEEQINFFALLGEELWSELDGQEQVDALVRARLAGLKNEQAEVELLLEMARRTEAQGPDAKAEALLEWIYRLQQEEAAPDLKALIFTEFVPTQDMLAEFLSQRGFSVTCLNGGMGMEERQRVQDEFAGPTRILVSTDAGGEGLNLQFCHVVVNYDIPWNPMRLEQRIGRVDRIGQSHPVRALNFTLHDTIENRVLEVLEEKLAVILTEFGVDKTADVLDSAQAEELFDELYRAALLVPQELDQKVDELMHQVQEQAQAGNQVNALLGSQGALEAALARQALDTPVPYWVERMTLAYLETSGGQARQSDGVYALCWPDGAEMPAVVFNPSQAHKHPTARYLTLQDERLRSLVDSLAPFTPGEAIPCGVIPNLPANLKGVWSLWRIRLLQTGNPTLSMQSFQRMLPLFVNEKGRVFLPTGRAIWDQLLLEDVQNLSWLTGDDAAQYHAQSRQAAEAQGQVIYQQMLQAYQAQQLQERDKALYRFSSRRKVIERVGLPEVRQYRLEHLEEEKRQWEQAGQRPAPLPDLEPILILGVKGNGDA